MSPLWGWFKVHKMVPHSGWLWFSVCGGGWVMFRILFWVLLMSMHEYSETSGVFHCKLKTKLPSRQTLELWNTPGASFFHGRDMWWGIVSTLFMSFSSVGMLLFLYCCVACFTSSHHWTFWRSPTHWNSFSQPLLGGTSPSIPDVRVNAAFTEIVNWIALHNTV